VLLKYILSTVLFDAGGNGEHRHWYPFA